MLLIILMAQLELLFLELAGLKTTVIEQEPYSNDEEMYIEPPISISRPQNCQDTGVSPLNILTSNFANASFHGPQTAPLNVNNPNLSTDALFAAASKLGALFRYIKTCECLPELRRAVDVEMVKPYLEMLVKVESETIFMLKKRLIQNQSVTTNASDAACFAGLAAFYKLKSCWHDQFIAVKNMVEFDAASVYELVDICRQNNIASAPKVLAFATKLADEKWRLNVLNAFCGLAYTNYDRPQLDSLTLSRLGNVIRFSTMFTTYGESDAAKFSINGLCDTIHPETAFSTPFSTLEPFYDCAHKNTQILMALTLPLSADSLYTAVEKCTETMYELMNKLSDHLAMKHAWKFLRTAQFFSAALFVDYFKDLNSKYDAWHRFDDSNINVDFTQWPLNVFFSLGQIGIYNEISVFLETFLQRLLAIGLAKGCVPHAYALVYTKLWQHFQFTVHDHLDNVKEQIKQNKDLLLLGFEAEASELKLKLLVDEPWMLSLLESTDFESLKLACAKLSIHPHYSNLDWTL